jgi:hypothetical protein
MTDPARTDLRRPRRRVGFGVIASPVLSGVVDLSLVPARPSPGVAFRGCEQRPVIDAPDHAAPLRPRRHRSDDLRGLLRLREGTPEFAHDDV